MSLMGFLVSKWPALWNIAVVMPTLAVWGPFLLPYCCTSAGEETSGLVGVSFHGAPLRWGCGFICQRRGKQKSVSNGSLTRDHAK